MSQMDDLDLIAKAYGSQVGAIRRQLQSFGDALWQALPDYRDENIDMLVQAIVPRVKAGQIQIANLTVAYVKQTLMAMGVKAPVTGVDEDAITSLRGVDPQEIYRRPAVSVYTALSQGKPLDQAVKEGGPRLYQLIGGDMQLAKTRQAHRSMRRARAGGVQFYCRILTGRENCGLCVVASTQHYRVDHVMPIHPGCDCDFGPLPPGTGEEWVIDPDTLEQVHSAVEERYGESDRGARSPDYSKMIMTTTHGEYGPVISWKESIAERKLKTKAGVKRSLSLLPDYYTKKANVPRTQSDLRGLNNRIFALIGTERIIPKGFSKLPVDMMSKSRRTLDGGVVRGEYMPNTGRILLNPELENLEITILHEYGHAIDHFLGAGTFASQAKGTIPNSIATLLAGRGTTRYLTVYSRFSRVEEIFARAYAQYFVSKIGNRSLKRAIKMAAETPAHQWSEEDFLEASVLFDELFGI